MAYPLSTASRCATFIMRVRIPCRRCVGDTVTIVTPAVEIRSEPLTVWKSTYPIDPTIRSPSYAAQRSILPTNFRKESSSSFTNVPVPPNPMAIALQNASSSSSEGTLTSMMLLLIFKSRCVATVPHQIETAVGGEQLHRPRDHQFCPRHASSTH